MREKEAFTVALLFQEELMTKRINPRTPGITSGTVEWSHKPYEQASDASSVYYLISADLAAVENQKDVFAGILVAVEDLGANFRVRLESKSADFELQGDALVEVTDATDLYAAAAEMLTRQLVDIEASIRSGSS